VVWGASTAASETWTGALVDLRAGAPGRATDAPGTIVIGEVVRVGAMLAGDLAGALGGSAPEADVYGTAAAQ
jgi:hypothetical protein